MLMIKLYLWIFYAKKGKKRLMWWTDDDEGKCVVWSFFYSLIQLLIFMKNCNLILMIALWTLPTITLLLDSSLCPCACATNASFFLLQNWMYLFYELRVYFNLRFMAWRRQWWWWWFKRELKIEWMNELISITNYTIITSQFMKKRRERKKKIQRHINKWILYSISIIHPNLICCCSFFSFCRFDYRFPLISLLHDVDWRLICVTQAVFVNVIKGFF